MTSTSRNSDLGGPAVSKAVPCAKPERRVIDGRICWVRPWPPDDGGDHFCARVTWCAGPDDTSPSLARAEVPYDSRCSACFFGHSHSLDKHAGAIESHL